MHHGQPGATFDADERHVTAYLGIDLLPETASGPRQDLQSLLPFGLTLRDAGADAGACTPGRNAEAWREALEEIQDDAPVEPGTSAPYGI